MSKSIGNILDPYSIIEIFKPVAGELAADVLRYYLLRHINMFDDSDMTIDSIKDAYQANLANGLGNLVSRIMTMVQNNNILVVEGLYEYKEENIQEYALDKYMNEVWELIQKIDKKIQEKEPFKLFKTDLEFAKEIVSDLATDLWVVAKKLAPVMPHTSETILRLLKENKKPETPLFARLP